MAKYDPLWEKKTPKKETTARKSSTSQNQWDIVEYADIVHLRIHCGALVALYCI